MTKICLIAVNQEEAYKFARSQNFEPDQWFYPKNSAELSFKNDFHVIVVGNLGQNFFPSDFEKMYQLALKRGKIGRI